MTLSEFTLDPDREWVMGRRAMGGGLGVQGSPGTQKLSPLQQKARGVLDGTERFSPKELGQVLAAVMLANG